MTFKEWSEWLGDLPWVFRWFPLLVLFRPVVDNLYFLKSVSPLLSPPYLVGVLTPIACIVALIRFRSPKKTGLDKAFLYWSVMVLISALLLLFYDPLSMLTFEYVLKITIPVYLYFFLRLFITDLRDLHGILQSFLYSTLFVMVLLLYEVFVNPISVQESRGLERIQASFGDVVSYGMYITFAVIIGTYYFFARQHLIKFNKRIVLLGIVLAFSILGLINIYHTASYSVFASLILLFMAYNFRSQNRTVAIGFVLVAGFAITVWGSEVIQDKVSPLIQTDIQVYEGQQNTDRLLHGRVGRWRTMLDLFSSESVPVQFFGFPLKFKYVFQFIGIGSHNDFIRMLFGTGIIGLALYLNLLFRVWRRRLVLGLAQNYLLIATLLALIFYSISVTPTFYAPFMYFALSIFAYVALPGNKLTQWANREY